MKPFVKLGLGILVLSSLVFVILFGQTPALRKGPVGKLRRILVERVPGFLVDLDRLLTRGRLTHAFGRTSRYLIHEGNPIVLCIFLLVLSTSVLLFLRACYFDLPSHHRRIAPILIAAPYIFTHLSVNSTASYITPANHSSRLHDYPFDHVLFRPGKTCRTCNFEKPARSKHCSFCRACVSRCDHHCPWVNNCLGKENYRWFVALLLSLGVLNLYGAYLSYLNLWPRTQLRDTADMIWSTKPMWDRLGTRLSTAFELGGVSVAGVGMLAALTAPLPFGLLAYHVYLIWAGMTTNESEKWKDLKEDMADGMAFRCSRDDAPYAVSEESHVPWPVSCDKVIICTSDGRPPGGHDQVFERVWDLTTVTNIYDLGVRDNLMYILRAR